MRPAGRCSPCRARPSDRSSRCTPTSRPTAPISSGASSAWPTATSLPFPSPSRPADPGGSVTEADDRPMPPTAPRQRVIGMLGGMSWESTIEYYRLANEGVRARLGGLHSARIVLASLDFAEIEALQVAG